MQMRRRPVVSFVYDEAEEDCDWFVVVVLQFSPLIQDTVLKGTFNATLNNPVAARMEAMGGPAGTTSHPFLLGV